MATRHFTPATPKQMYAIKMIEKTLKVKFTGRSKSHAQAFIGKYIELSMTVSKDGSLTNESALVLLNKSEW